MEGTEREKGEMWRLSKWMEMKQGEKGMERKEGKTAEALGEGKRSRKGLKSSEREKRKNGD